LVLLDVPVKLNTVLKLFDPSKSAEEPLLITADKGVTPEGITNVPVPPDLENVIPTPVAITLAPFPAEYSVIEPEIQLLWQFLKLE